MDAVSANETCCGALLTFDVVNGVNLMFPRVLLISGMVAIVGAGSVWATEPRSDSEALNRASLAHRPLVAIQRDVHAALRAEALARRRSPNSADVWRLVDLYLELAAHPKRDESGQARNLSLKLRSRLMEVSEHIERRSGRAARLAKTEAVSSFVGPDTHVLAQQVVVAGGAAAGQGAPAVAAGPVALQVVDYGPQLVEIIQATISPLTWDLNGGSGAVAYFAPSRALVVRARGDVHRQVADLLWQLRAVP
jgi:hypothetical protein